MGNVVEQALKELEEEKFRAAVESKKQQLKWPLWKRLFPYKIQIKLIDLREERWTNK